jgi:hypothetical protein
MNKNIAIKGHINRGKEIIKILEKLGNISSNLHGTLINQYYFIMNNVSIVASGDKENDLKDYILYESIEEYENSNKIINYQEI